MSTQRFYMDVEPQLVHRLHEVSRVTNTPLEERFFTSA